MPKRDAEYVRQTLQGNREAYGLWERKAASRLIFRPHYFVGF